MIATARRVHVAMPDPSCLDPCRRPCLSLRTSGQATASSPVSLVAAPCPAGTQLAQPHPGDTQAGICAYLRISNLCAASGSATMTSLSNRPGRRSAGSRALGRFVAPTTTRWPVGRCAPAEEVGADAEGEVGAAAAGGASPVPPRPVSLPVAAPSSRVSSCATTRESWERPPSRRGHSASTYGPENGRGFRGMTSGGGWGQGHGRGVGSIQGMATACGGFPMGCASHQPRMADKCPPCPPVSQAAIRVRGSVRNEPP